MVLSSDVAPTALNFTYNMELVLNIADRYTGNIYASASQTLKGAGKTEQAAYNNAFQQQNIRNGKYKAMVEKAKGIVEYFNTHCDLAISRAKSLADQYNWRGSLGIIIQFRLFARSADKCNEAASELAKMPVVFTVEEKAK